MNNLGRVSRSSRSAAATLLPTTIVVVLAAVTLSAVDRIGPGAPHTVPASPAIHRPANLSGTTTVVLRTSGGTATATLEDTPVAHRLAAGLPVRLTLRDPMGQAKSGRLPTPLDVAAAERVLEPEVAGIYYWPPTGDVGIMYDDLGQTVPPPGLVRVGTVTSGLPVIAGAGNRFTVVVEVVP